MPVSPLHGGATKCGRLAANDGMLEVATNKRVPPLAVLEVAASNVRKLEVAANKWVRANTKMSQVVAWARKSKFQNSDANTRARASTWVDSDCTRKISMRQDVEMQAGKQPETLDDEKQKTLGKGWTP